MSNEKDRGDTVTYQQNEKAFAYTKNQKHAADDENDGWASDSGSSTGSYYSNSTGSAIEWESEISPSGEVFYIKSMTEFTPLTNNKTDKDSQLISPPPELTRRRSTRTKKLMRLIKRKESYRHSVRLSGLASEFKRNHETISKLNKERENALGNFKMGEKYTVNIWVDPEKRHKLGRRATVCEAYLGIVPQVASDKSKIIVGGFVPDGEALKCKDIRVGDWLQSINSKEVTNQNIESILTTITSQKYILCQLQKSVPNESCEDLPDAELSFPNQSILAKQLIDKEESRVSMESFIKDTVGIVCVKINEFTDSESDLQGVSYSYPRSSNKNALSFLVTIKGAFVTLNHMLPDIAGPKPISTTIKTSSGIQNIIYDTFGEDLLLICLPEKCCDKHTAIELLNDITCCLSFTYGNLSKCFIIDDNHKHLDHFFYLFFSQLCNKSKTQLTSVDDTNAVTNSDDKAKMFHLENLLPSVQSLQLPRDAQIQVDAALSEMEAMDYRDWNQDPLECQRLYTIIGSCYYHRRYLIGSHLPPEDLKQIQSFLRRNGLLNLIDKEQVKSLVVWKRVYPSSCLNRKFSWNEDQVYPLVDKWFLLIVGNGHDLLAVILESGGCTAVLAENAGPDIFYVEEAQETLKHIRKIGIPMLAEKWINANAKPEIVAVQKGSTPSKASPNISDNLMDYIKTNQLRSSNNMISTTPKSSFDASNVSKNRSVEDARFDSAHSFETSRDSPSQDSLSQVSSLSDQTAPILGRRATRERANFLASKPSDDDSDSDLDTDQSIINELSSIRANLLNQAEYIVPKIITSGEKNSLVYFVHIHLFEGILISSNISQIDREFLSHLKSSSQTIHRLLSETKRYKKLLSQDVSKSVINKSLIAIKEYGILFEWENNTYWVVGRLYNAPQPRELYICYQDCAPQNLIEMSFRLQCTNF
ncbi:protein inturned [Trichogramma pretiosum]|uniref:protein inturned n=1 Tax=Trichogramma pretiosum TaxID=7493 RepID=UPI0006C95513|nr:protein inturned [Trichogramma pretiosum]